MVLNLHDIEIDGTTESSLRKGAKKLVQHIKPNWTNGELKYKIYTDGISNRLIGVWCQNFDDQILVRVYGEKTELFIDRNAETKNINLLYKLNCGPELYATFKNGLSYAYIPGTPVSINLITQEEIWDAVSRQAAKLHRIKVDNLEPCLFPKLRNFMKLLPDSFSDDQMTRLNEAGISKRFLERELNQLEKVLISAEYPVVFSHNDLLLNNIIWDEKKKVTHFIDFEYAGTNYQPFDIANHFCEFVGVGLSLDYENSYPSLEFQRRWIAQYLGYYYNKSTSEILEDEVEKWVVWVRKFTLASHMFWGLWALLQACHSTIDFDFLQYSVIRLDEYKKKKAELLPL